MADPPRSGGDADRQALRRRNRELTILRRLAGISLAAPSPSRVLDRLLGEVADALNAPEAAVEHLEADGERLVVAATHGFPFPAGPEVEMRASGTAGARAVRSGRRVTVVPAAAEGPEVPGYLRGRGGGALVALPLLVEAEARGALLLRLEEGRSPPGEAWTAWAMELAGTLALHVGRMEAEDALRAERARHRATVEELRRANAELEAFAYSISHDLRAPLRTMQGFAHALRRDFGSHLGDEARDYARRIIASGREAEKLINDLLGYSRLSFAEIQREPVELDPVVEAALAQVQGDLDARGARVEVRRPLPTVPGNRTVLVQVMANLLSNAARFVPPDRTPEITVRAEDDGHAVRVLVEDNGVGIPAGQEERIFQLFERLHHATDVPGTGIGLALVRRGVERLGGRCGVEPRDPGSAFWIRVSRERRSRPDSWSRRG